MASHTIEQRLKVIQAYYGNKHSDQILNHTLGDLARHIHVI